MKIHTVKQGESLVSIASKYGFGQNWQALYESADNDDFRSLRTNPNCIFPGDKINIPEDTGLTVTYAAEGTYKFKMSRPRAFFAIKLTDGADIVYSNINYELHIEDQIITGTTNSNGVLEEEVPVDIEVAKLIFWPYDDLPERAVRRRVNIGHLDPIEEITGQRQRLANQGFPSGRIVNEWSEPSINSVKWMQLARNYDISEQLTDQSLDRLQQYEV